MHPMAKRSILVLAYDAVHATELVRVLETAGAETVVTANAHEALQRLDQFSFDAAVIDCSPGAEGVSDRLRAVLHLRRRDLKGSFADLDTAIRLNPRNVAALSNRASVHLAVENYAAALSDFDLALSADSGNAATYLARGRAHLFSGALNESIEDFKTAVRLRPSNPYPVIWLHIARVHKGEADSQELDANAKNVARDIWPGAMIDLYLGLLDADAVKAAALSGDHREKVKRHCEATFFLGEWAMHAGQAERARDAMREVIANCGPQEVAYSAAVAELKLLPRQ